MPGYTPMMRQYLEIKNQYKDCLLFFRLGDFYELFFDDAKITSKELGLTLTTKSCGTPEKAPMCGVPFHSADSYITKLVNKGYKVAICEQTEDPRRAKSIVKREVIRIITQGTLIDDTAIDEGVNNYIMCLYFTDKAVGLSLCDVSTGAFLTSCLEGDNKIIDEIAKHSPSQIVVNKKTPLCEAIYSIFGIKREEYHNWAFNVSDAGIRLCNHFGVMNLSGYGIEGDEPCICASGALLEYLYETQKNELSNIRTLRKYSDSSYMILDISSRNNLELTKTLRDKNKKGSLLWVLDNTKTPGGARLIRNWIEQPLINTEDIKKRQDGVEAFKNNVIDREELREYLSAIHDIDRIMGKIVYLTANAKDLNALKASLENLPHIKLLLDCFPCGCINEIKEGFDTLEDIYSLLNSAISENAPFSLREGGLIKKGFSEEVDKLNEAKKNGTNWICEFEAKEKARTGIKNLRIKFNKVFGYSIEITNSYAGLVPEEYVRKQTLSGAERYITPELKEIEDVILGADEKVIALEYELFCEVRNRIAAQINRIQKTSESLSEIDVLCSLGEAADKNNYCRPEVNEESILDIKGGRHPVVELMGTEAFIPNDLYMDSENDRLLIITGPNMAGKSTYMRQTALLVLMAQIGSFIPATSATIGVCDRIFTRVGASDDLATGQSTFMVEMTEVANILNNATKRSLLILDEIGRGTSTYDGLSIARAVLEYIAAKRLLGARSLFATHYHELTELEGRVEGVKNYCVAVEERGENVIFLRKIIKGGTDKSYGIHVARLAGVPERVLKRAEQILSSLVKGAIVSKGTEKITEYRTTPEEKKPKKKAAMYETKPLKPMELWFDESDDAQLLLEISELDTDNMTPMQALEKLTELKRRVKDYL